MNNLSTKTSYQSLSMSFGDEPGLHLTFTLDVKDGIGVGFSGGAVWDGENYIGSFDGLMGFAHNIEGERADAVTALLSDLSDALEENYGVPKPVVIEPEQQPVEQNETSEETISPEEVGSVEEVLGEVLNPKKSKE